MESSKKLRAQRAQLLGAMARHKKYIEGLDTKNLDSYLLEVRKQKLAQLWEKFDVVQEEIEVADDHDFENENFREQFEGEYFGLMARFNKLLADVEKGQVEHMEDAQGALSEDSKERVQLPQVNIKKFSGKCEDWLPFYNLFKSLVHENKKFGDLQKFYYLRSYLADSAADVISDLELTPANYQEAWNLLKERYDNRRLIVKNHVKALFDAPAVTRENSVALRGFVDYFKRHLRALRSLDSDAGNSSDLLTHLVLSKMDASTVREWEAQQGRSTKLNINDLLNFLTEKCEILEVIKNPVVPQQNSPRRKVQSMSASVSATRISCPLCKENHGILQCNSFKNLNVNERYQKVMSKGLCINCLKSGSHLAKNCFARGCNICKEKHHELLHEKFSPGQSNATVSCLANNMENETMLSTIKLEIFASDGRKHFCRAVLDSGSQSDFISERLAKLLKLEPQIQNFAIVGIGQKALQTVKRVKVKVKSRINDYCTTLRPLVLEEITEALPLKSFNKNFIKIPKDVVLADPEFNISSTVDLLIGAQGFWNCLQNDSIQLTNQPRLQATRFGWVIAGEWKISPGMRNVYVNNLAFVKREPIDLTKFWETEELAGANEFTIEEKYCIAHFERTYKRDHTGRFIVELPLKQEKLCQLGNNKKMALQRFYNLESKLRKNPTLKSQYVEFMREYERLGHMVEVSDESRIGDDGLSYYLPHHCVVNQNSLTTKLRVVFDGSASDKINLSLNQVLMTGPVLQQGLFSLLVRFRTLRYVLTADIKKMYRQIRLAESQMDLQRIFWRETPDSKLKTYKLATVTYGTTSASFLAIKALQELAKIEGAEYPLGAKVVLRDFYVDDLITGAATKEELLMIRDEVTKLLKKGGMELAKWGTNAPDLLYKSELNADYEIHFDKTLTHRTLGVKWWPVADQLGYTVQELPTGEDGVTKRTILSTIAKIFDPLGLIGPYVILAKVLLQRLWELKLGWDDEVSDDIRCQWNTCLNQIKNLEKIKVPRFIISDIPLSEIEIHGFCDASERAYGACLYLRSTSKNGGLRSQLLCAKSRVAPLKTISLPRLELCAAVLLAKLIIKVKSSLGVAMHKIFCWTDSKIVLAWLGSSSRKWSVFVAHRVGTIQDSVGVEAWRHVPSEENPADIISRGCSQKDLESLTLWWNGPEWLYVPGREMPCEMVKLNEEEIPERKQVLLNVLNKEPFFLFKKYGTYKRLLRITAYLERFIKNCKSKRDEREVTSLTNKNFESAERTLIKIVQAEEFNEELTLLKGGRTISRKGKILNLAPFLDEEGILRVGRRLQNSELPWTQKHPIILPSKHPLTRLILLHEHERLLHTGAQTTLAVVREKFWPVAVRSFLKALIRNCVVCRKASPITPQYIMGSLPKQRIIYTRPFQGSGVDYCGPFLIKESKGRNSKTTKIWVAAFVCLSVKAVHLELATDLTAEGFLNALKRFIARRGMVQCMYSDNATNFAAASKELSTIEWHFIPPRSPHFGGLWEAAVKAFKVHFKRVVGEHLLTYEEFNTLAISIEAILNSRPLVPLSDDINDYSCLTPAHFLIGDSLLARPETDYEVEKADYGRRWHLVQRLKQFFWERWSREYLRGCQIRSKWNTTGSPMEEGQLVMVMEGDSSWTLGRIIQIHKGSDGVVRVAKVRTAKGEFVRSVKKLAALPIPISYPNETVDYEK